MKSIRFGIRLAAIATLAAVGSVLSAEPGFKLGQDWMVGFNVTPVVPSVLANWLGGN